MEIMIHLPPEGGLSVASDEGRSGHGKGGLIASAIGEISNASKSQDHHTGARNSSGTADLFGTNEY
jgi:hypothetical protein